jgi:hypothetical protein
MTIPHDPNRPRCRQCKSPLFDYEQESGLCDTCAESPGLREAVTPLASDDDQDAPATASEILDEAQVVLNVQEVRELRNVLHELAKAEPEPRGGARYIAAWEWVRRLHDATPEGQQELRNIEQQDAEHEAHIARKFDAELALEQVEYPEHETFPRPLGWAG